MSARNRGLPMGDRETTRGALPSNPAISTERRETEGAPTTSPPRHGTDVLRTWMKEDPEIVREVAERKLDELERRAGRAGADAFEAADAAAETVWSAMTRPAEWSPRKSLGAWMNGSTVRRVRRLVRRRVREVSLDDGPPANATADAPPPSISVRDPRAGPATEARRKDQVVAALAAAERRSPEHRVAFWLTKGEGLTCFEAAAAMGRPAGTVRRLVAEAVEAARETLEDRVARAS